MEPHAIAWTLAGAFGGALAWLALGLAPLGVPFAYPVGGSLGFAAAALASGRPGFRAGTDPRGIARTVAPHGPVTGRPQPEVATDAGMPYKS